MSSANFGPSSPAASIHYACVTFSRKANTTYFVLRNGENGHKAQ
jgi:hypothetical protein